MSPHGWALLRTDADATMLPLAISLLLTVGSAIAPIAGLPPPYTRSAQVPIAAPKDASVLILGGGIAGITAATALHEQGVEDFIVLEARHELGGRMLSHTFGAPDQQYTVELGANWVQGTRTGDGPENPIWTLAKKHNITTRKSAYFDGLSRYHTFDRPYTALSKLGTYDETGQVDYHEKVKQSSKNFDRLIASAGTYRAQLVVASHANTWLQAREYLTVLLTQVLVPAIR